MIAEATVTLSLPARGASREMVEGGWRELLRNFRELVRNLGEAEMETAVDQIGDEYEMRASFADVADAARFAAFLTNITGVVAEVTPWEN